MEARLLIQQFFMTHRMTFLRRILCASVCAMLAIPNVAPFASADEGPSIVIGEIAWAGSTKSTADEWIELWNRSGSPISLSGWSLVGAGENNRRIVFAADAIIPAHGTYLIGNYAGGDVKSTLSISPNVVTSTISLSNSTVAIELRDASDNPVDIVGDGGTPAAGASLPIKLTMVRTNPLLAGTDESAWSSATVATNLIADVNDLGTPGICDGCAPEETPEPLPEPTPVEPEPVPEPTPSPEPIPVPEVPAENPTTSTEPTPTTPEEPPTEEPQTETPTTTEPESSVPPVVTEESELPKPAYGMLRLSEFAPNPESGKEWIEIVSLDETNIIPLGGVEIHDAAGKIFTFPDLTLNPATSTYVRIELTSSKLNNGGDTVVLYDPEGHLLDAVTYDSTAKGEVWVRFPSPDGSWRTSKTPTPGSANQWEAEPLPAPTPTPIPTPTPAPIPVVTSTTPTTTPSTKPTPRAPTALEIDAARRSYETWDGKTTVVKKPVATKPVTPKTTSVKKTSAQSKTSTVKTPTPITFDMRTSDAFGNIKVKLTGTVGTPPGLLANRSFILFSADGRGLEVRVPSSKKLPEAGLTLDVIGTLAFSAEGFPYLRVAANESWITHTTTPAQISPRVADLIAPGAEDAWSFVQVTGTVMSVNGSTVSLDLGDATVDVYFRPAAGYRAKRLVAGDTIVVRGVLEADHDPIRILPRYADDVVILSHAEEEQNVAASSNNLNLPPWMPFGAAAGAVAVAEGAKRAHQARKRRALERAMTTTLSVAAK
jgi:outer membrane biosynthesis protein TonB